MQRYDDQLTGWTLHSNYLGTVHFDTDYDSVSEGSQAVQLEVGGDWISQTFATVIDQDYTVSFDLSAFSRQGNLGPGGVYYSSDLGVTVGTIYEEFTGSSEGYSTKTLQFTADSSATTLKFENLGVLNEWGNYPHIDNVSVTADPIIVTIVTIDIKPGSDPNEIKPRSNRKVPVAILTTEKFNAATVDADSVRFGPDAALPVHYALEYVDGDTTLDWVLQFKTRDTGIACGDTEASLTGETFDGVKITGTDSIETVGCKK